MRALARMLRRWWLQRRLAHAQDSVWAETQALLAARAGRRRAVTTLRVLQARLQEPGQDG